MLSFAPPCGIDLCGGGGGLTNGGGLFGGTGCAAIDVSSINTGGDCGGGGVGGDGAVVYPESVSSLHV